MQAHQEQELSSVRDGYQENEGMPMQCPSKAEGMSLDGTFGDYQREQQV